MVRFRKENSMKLTKDVIEYIEGSKGELMELLEALCRIPAPSGHEEARAEFCHSWLSAQGSKDVYIDSALNVICPINCDGRDDIVVFMAHTDTVFPDTEPMPYHTDDKYAYSPGIGDDTASLVVLMMVAKYILKNDLKPNCGILIVANSCEEGLGNLKGTKQLMADYEGRIKEVYTFDNESYANIIDKCVGSHRYKISFATEGGHSFQAFGKTNAIAVMSELICRLYKCEPPVINNSRTSYNVGIVSGGTSVNTISQSAEMLYEYRSDTIECLNYMNKFFENTVDQLRSETDAVITVDVIGKRPCANDYDKDHHEAMLKKCIDICEQYTDTPCQRKSASTDCNIPMSLGIPSVCIGVYVGNGAHTREERVEIDSLPVGMKIAAELMLGYFDQ